MNQESPQGENNETSFGVKFKTTEVKNEEYPGAGS